MAILNGHNNLFKMAISTDLKVRLWPKELWLTRHGYYAQQGGAPGPAAATSSSRQAAARVARSVQ